MTAEKNEANRRMFGLKRKLVTGCGNTHLVAFFDVNDGRLVETFYVKGSSGGCASSYTAISRLISLASRSGLPVDEIIDQLLSTEPCPSYRTRTVVHKDTSKGTSCASAIGYALQEMIADAKGMVQRDAVILPKKQDDANEFPTLEGCCTITELNTIPKAPTSPAPKKPRNNLFPNISGSIKEESKDSPLKCPECNSDITFSGGCMICNACGWSKCD